MLPAWIGFVALLGTQGCISTPRVQTTLHESAQGLVALREFADFAQRATHPATLDPAVMRRVLRGVYVQEQKALLDAVVTGTAEPRPVFSEEESEFLAPLLVSGVAQATPGEAVRFRVVHGNEGRGVRTEGSLYLAGDVWHVQVARYRAPSSRQAFLSRPQGSFVRATRWTLLFRPEAAWLNGATELVVSPGPTGSNSSTLAISTTRLSQRPAPDRSAAGRPEATAVPGPPAEARDTRAEELEREVQELRRALQEQQQQLRGLEERLEERGNYGR